jgi:Ca2+-binding RTX toxin-like protein
MAQQRRSQTHASLRERRPLDVRRPRRPGLELLEDRVLPSITASIDPHGTLNVAGDNNNQTIALRLSPTDATKLQVVVNSSVSNTFTLSQVSKINVTSGDGNDVVQVDESNGSFSSGRPITLQGGAGNDTLQGGPSGNVTLIPGSGTTVLDDDGANDQVVVGPSLATIAAQVNGFLQNIQSSIDNVVYNDSLPLLGTQLKSLGQVIDSFSGQVQSALSGLPANPDVQFALYNALGPAGLNILGDTNGDGTIGPADVLVTNTGTGDSSVLTYEVLLHQGVTATAAPNLDLGLQGIPLKVATQGGLNLGVGFNFDFKFGVKGVTSPTFFLDTSKLNELQIYVNASLTPDATIDAQLFFLQAAIQDGPADPMHPAPATTFNGTFNVDLTDTNGSEDPHQTSLANLGLDASLTANADLNLYLQLGFADPASSNPSTVAPRLLADFHLGWSFNSADTTSDPSSFGDAPDVEFNHVRLDLGSFFTSFVGPIVREIQTVTKPLQPLVDVLTTRVPVLSDLEGHTVTFADLISQLSGVNISPFLDAINTINHFAVPTVGNFTIDLGSFSTTDARGSSVDVAGSNPTDPNAIQNEITSDGGGAFFSEEGSASEDPPGPLPDSPPGLHFPIIENPLQDFRLLLGQSVDLFTYTMPQLSGGFDFGATFPIFPPFFSAFIHGHLGFSADLTFGYDTTGLQEFISDSNHPAADLLDGFFVSQTVVGGVKQPIFAITGQLDAGLEGGVNLGFAAVNAGLDGGIRATVNFGLDDIHGNNKLRVSDIVTIVQANPICLFDISGKVSAFLDAFVNVQVFGITVYNQSFNLLNVDLVNFNFDCSSVNAATTHLATLDGNGKLTIAKSTGDNNITITHVSGTKGNETLAVTSKGLTQTFSGVKNIFFDDTGGTGHDTITVASGVLDDAEIHGGNGGNQLTYSGSGNSKLFGGNGNDQLQGGSGTDYLSGGGGGSDLLKATSGNDTLVAGNGTDRLYGGSGNNVFIGGSGTDTFVCGSGPNQVSGGSGINTVIWNLGNGPLSFTSGGGQNELDVQGTTGNDSFAVSPNGGGVVVATSGGTVSAAGVQKIALIGGGGSDSFTVGDLSGTGVAGVGIQANPGASGDGAGDVITVAAAAGSNNLSVTAPTGFAIQVNGLPYQMSIAQASVADGDRLIVAANNNGDTIQAFPGVEQQVLLTMQGGTGNDTFYGGFGQETMIGGGGTDRVVVSRDANFSLTDTSLAIGSDTHYALVGVPQAILTGGPSGNTFTVSNWSGTAYLDGAGGGDAFIVNFVGAGGGTTNITESNPAGTNTVTVNGPGFGGSFLITPTQVKLGGETVNYGNVQALTVNAVAGNNTLTVNGDSVPTTVNGGSGTDAVIANGPFAAALFVNGTGGSTSLTVNGTPNVEAFVITGTTVDGLGATITYTRLATLTVNGQGGNDLFTVNGDSVPTTVNGAGGNDAFIVNAPLSAPLALNGNGGTDTATVNGTDANHAFAITATTIDGTGATITYAGMAFLFVNGLSGNNAFTMTGIYPTTVTTLNGGPGFDTFVGAFPGSFVGSLTLLDFESINMQVNGDFTGSLLASSPGAIQQLGITGSVTAGSTITADSIATLTIGQALAGLITLSGALGTGSIGSVAPTGVLVAGGNVTTNIAVAGTMSGFVRIGPAASVTTTPAGLATVPSPTTGSGNVPLMTVGGDLSGTLEATGTLTKLAVTGGTPGNIVAGHVGTIQTAAGYGPFVLQVNENGTQRRAELAVPSNPYPLLVNPPQLPPPRVPATATVQYLYESGSLANPQLTARVTSTSGTADQFDLSLTTYNDTAKFNLARLDAVGVSGIRNIAIEGDLLTSVSAAAQAAFTLSNTTGGIRLPLDVLASVGVRDYAPNNSIQARSIQALAFGSHSKTTGQIFTGATSQGSDAAILLVSGTAIVQANDTFRVPFADLPTQQVGLFLVTDHSGGHFDDHSILLTVEGVSVPNGTMTANVVTPSNAARGAATALVTVVPTYDHDGHLQNSVVQSIAIRGDGAAIQTEQLITQLITGTGSLGDLTLKEGNNTPLNVTAANIFGSVDLGGALAGTVQTTGIRTDPITGAQSAAAADLGRLFLTFTDRGPVLTATTLHAENPGLLGRLIVRGNLISQAIFDGGISGVVAIQGDVSGTLALDRDGHPVRLGGIVSNGPVRGQLVVLGNAVGNVVVHGPLQGGRLAVKGSALGNLEVDNGIDAGGALVVGGNAGNAAAGTTLTVSGDVLGILAVKGTVNLGKPVSTSHAAFYGTNLGTTDLTSAAALDALFTDGGLALSLDVNALDLGGLALILKDLAALHVGSNGKLIGPVA